MNDTNLIFFPNANSRPTYFTIHNVNEAHKYSKGSNIKVGIIDWLFAASEYKELYAGTVDFTNSPYSLYEANGHGLWMATAMREIAPECEIYALNAVIYEEHKNFEENDLKRSEYLNSAIDWAIENGIDVLTYSHPKFTPIYSDIVNNCVDRAAHHEIATTFIHNENPNNIWPYGCFEYHTDQQFTREPDVNIYHYDYNSLSIPQYESYLDFVKSGEHIKSGNDLPYFSFSSMSPVLGGFVALLKSIRPSLTPYECKGLLIKTSYAINEKGEHWYDINPCPRVVDIGKAVKSLIK